MEWNGFGGRQLGNFRRFVFVGGEKKKEEALVWFGLFNRSSRARALLDSTELGEEEKISQQRSRAHM
jgi:hypothetical protein